ncbi:MAG: protoporphyrinogen oxidase [Thermoprotei archaeon]|nr:MAG: protoporphyrinogen oxidase [Thermoprotei archaeon]
MKINEYTVDVFEGVYPPSEDSFLLYDSIPKEYVKRALDVGSGTGILTLKLTEIADYVVAIDVSSKACRNTLHNVKLNKRYKRADVVRGDLLNPFRKGSFQLILFNPPYLPVDENVDEICLAWSGGRGGIEVVVRFLQSLKFIIDRKSKVYLLLSSLMDLKTLFKFLNSYFNWSIVAKRSVGLFEELIVICLRKT